MLGLLIGCSITGILVGWFCYYLGYRRGLVKGAGTWLVRPHTARTLARMPLPEQGEPTVSQALFARTNLPGSTSKME